MMIMKYEPFHLHLWGKTSQNFFSLIKYFLVLQTCSEIELEGVCCLSDIFDMEKEALLTCNIYIQWSLSVINVLIKYDVIPGVSISHKILTVCILIHF